MKQNRKKDNKRIEANDKLIREIKCKQMLLQAIDTADGLAMFVKPVADMFPYVIKKGFHVEKELLLSEGVIKVRRTKTWVDLMSHSRRRTFANDIINPSKEELKQICNLVKRGVYARHVYDTVNGEKCKILIG